MSYNKVILMGRITHDLELKTTPNGANVCTFQIAVDRRFQANDEARKSDFIRVEAWRQQAEFLCRYFGKGRMVLVEGELHIDAYTDKNGNIVKVTRVVAEQICFTGEKLEDNGNGGYVEHTSANNDLAQNQTSQGTHDDFSHSDVINTDEYPF